MKGHGMPEKRSVKIGRKNYPIRSANQMARSEIRNLKALHARANDQDPEALWELLELFVPDAKGDPIDALTIDQIQAVLREADIITGELDEPSLGESSASQK